MNVSNHFVMSIALFIILFPVYKFWAFFVFLSGVFIDVDHYIWGIFKFKHLNLWKTYKFCKNREFAVKRMLHIFHTIEFAIFFGILCIIFYNTFPYVVFPLMFSFVVHLIMDYVHYLKDKPIHDRVFSVFELVKKKD